MAAAMLFDRVERTLSRLLVFPVSGRTLPEYPNAPFREVLVHPFRFFYKRVGPNIVVSEVWHEAQLPHDPTS